MTSLKLDKAVRCADLPQASNGFEPVKAVRLVLGTIILAAACNVPCKAAEGWSWSRLNPFSKQTSKKSPRAVSGSAVNRKKEPSLISKMGSSTKDMFTADTPQEKKAKAAKAAAQARAAKRKKSKDKGLFGTGWFAEKEEEPQTVEDWMRQPRVAP